MTQEGTRACPVPLVLPIVFVPGIMGSRLQNRDGETVWNPGVGQALSWSRPVRNTGVGWTDTLIPLPYPTAEFGPMSPAERKARLVGPTFSPDFLSPATDPGQLPSAITDNPERQAKSIARGYAGLAWDFYGPFMLWMEQGLVAALDDFPPECGNIRLEPWAHPYNWTDTNETAGQKLKELIDDTVKPQVEAAYGEVDPAVEILDPVVVTHSMGGLVGRACAKLSGGEGSVHGMIHGAMPTHGAPAAYKRMRAGFEGGDFGTIARESVARDVETRDRDAQNAIVRFFNDSYEGWRAIGRGTAGVGTGAVARLFLGATAAEVTPLLANMPGGLQLLPNQYHKDRQGRRDWLRVTYAREGDILTLPDSNPYEEIYNQRDKWYRLVTPSLIDPGNSSATVWTQYLTRLSGVADFHQELEESGGFHANTKMFYSASSHHPCFDTVEWKAEVQDSRLRAKMSVATDMPDADNLIGTVAHIIGQETRVVTGGMGMAVPYEADVLGKISIQEQDAPGDGTVHVGSGIHVPSRIESDPTTRANGGIVGYAHDAAYNDDDARRQVAAWISDMIVAQLEARGLG
ncbi:MAG: hypothetical protein AAGK98_06025 [Pseudomonadota bacterium]